MTNSESDRDAIYDAHLGNGWVLYATSDRYYGFRRGEVMVSIWFTEDGAIVTANRTAGSGPVETTRELYVVIEWLTGSAEDADQDRVAELEAVLEHTTHAARVRIAELEREVERMRELAELRLAQVIELERKLETSEDRAAGWNSRTAQLETKLADTRQVIEIQAADYRSSRERITELEDAAAPMRATIVALRGELAALRPRNVATVWCDTHHADGAHPLAPDCVNGHFTGRYETAT
jgi:hypothetical protein